VKEGWDIIKEFGFGPLPKNIVCPKDGDEMVLVSEGQFTMTNCIDQKLLEHGKGDIILNFPTMAINRNLGKPESENSLTEFIGDAGWLNVRTDIDAVLEYFKGKIPCIIDGGQTDIREPSTIVDIASDPPRIIRQGAVSSVELRKILSDIRVK